MPSERRSVCINRISNKSTGFRIQVKTLDLGCLLRICMFLAEHLKQNIIYNQHIDLEYKNNLSITKENELTSSSVQKIKTPIY